MAREGGGKSGKKKRDKRQRKERDCERGERGRAGALRELWRRGQEFFFKDERESVTGEDVV